ncbi:MAG: sigma-70 family RNA polymerase sigma factor [Bryobacteraceae bacterium]
MHGAGETLLVALAQNGDPAALEALLRKFYRPLRAYVAPMVGAAHADDVLQEVAVAIFQNLRYLRHPAAFRAWVFQIASRQVFRHLKREARWRRAEADPETLDRLPSNAPSADSFDPGLLAAVDQVSAASRAVLLLHYAEGLSIEECALVLDIPIGTAKSRLAYGISVLRKIMQSKGPQ